MKFFHNLFLTIFNLNWYSLFSNVQKVCVYTPLILVPWIFSPLSTDPFYIEKVFVILFFSGLSLIAWSVKNFLSIKSSQVARVQNCHQNKPSKFYFTKLLFLSVIFSVFVFISQMYSISFEQGFWGVGTVLFFSISIWLLAIYQVFEINLFKACLTCGITGISIINLIILITRFNGAGIWSFVHVQSFSANGDILSLLFLLFVGLILCLKSSFVGKYRYVYISGLFLNLITFIVYSYFVNIYIFAYIALILILLFYFSRYFKFQLNKGLKTKELLIKKSLPSELKELNSKKNTSIKQFSNTTTLIFKVTIVIAAVLVGIFEIFLQKDIIPVDRSFFPLNSAWFITVKSITDSPKNIVLGVGPNTYNYTYLHYKPSDINTTSFWGVSYTSSLYGILELVSDLGFGSIILILIINLFLNKKREGFKRFTFSKLVLIFKHRDHLYLLLIGLLGVLFLFLTPILPVTIWILACLLVLYYKEPQQVDLVFNLSSGVKYNKEYSKFLLLITNALIIIPSFIFLYYFLVGSVFLSLGYNEPNIEKISRGIITFPYYPRNYVVAVNTLKNITDDNQRNNYLNIAQNYTRVGLQYDTISPEENLISISAYNDYKPDYTTSSVVESIYEKLLLLYPNHIPFYLGLADTELQLGNNSSAGTLLDKVLNQKPYLDIALVKRANIYYLQSKYDEAKTLCNYLKSNSNDTNILNAVDTILSKVGNQKTAK